MVPFTDWYDVEYDREGNVRGAGADDLQSQQSHTPWQWRGSLLDRPLW